MCDWDDPKRQDGQGGGVVCAKLRGAISRRELGGYQAFGGDEELVINYTSTSE
jgi:hypothetical protein